jgi:phage shock protein C
LGVDSVLIRIAFVVLALAGGSGGLVYVVAWILVPEEKEGESLGQARPPSGETLRLIFGGVLIAVGAIALLGISFPHLWKYIWPLALIAIGLVIVVQASARR